MDNTVEQRRARRGQRRRRRRTRRGRRGGVRSRRPLPSKSVTKPLTIPFLRGMEGVFSATAQRAICAAHLRAVEIERDLGEIAKKLDVVGMCKHVCAQRRAALLAAGKAKQMAKPMSSAFADAQLAAAKLKWQAIYFTYLNRIVESFAVSDVKLSAIIGPVLLLQLVAVGFGHNGLRVVGRRQPLSAEGKATRLILQHFRRRVQAMRGATTSFSVRTLYVPFAEGTVLSQRKTNARGAFVDVKNGDVQVLYLPDRVRVEQVVYRDERAEDCESESFEVRGGADNADEDDESDFDHVAAELCDLIVGRVAQGADVDWPITGVFMTPREYENVVAAVGGVSLERIGAVDPGVGLLVLGRIGTRLAHAVKTNQPPFTISKKQKKKTVVQRQAQKRFRAVKLEKVAERALRALTLDGVPIDTLVCGDGFRNKSTRNSKRLGGFGDPALLMDAVDVKTAFCTEVFTTRVRRDTSGRFVLLQRVASFLPRGRLPSGRVVVEER